MKTVKAFVNGEQLLESVYVADNFFTRLKGLMFRGGLEKKTGMLIKPCSQIHTFWMRFKIDAVFMANDCKVLYVENSIPPGKITKYVSKSRQVLELGAGEAENIKPGCIIDFVEPGKMPASQ